MVRTGRRALYDSTIGSKPHALTRYVLHPSSSHTLLVQLRRYLFLQHRHQQLLHCAAHSFCIVIYTYCHPHRHHHLSRLPSTSWQHRRRRLGTLSSFISVGVWSGWVSIPLPGNLVHCSIGQLQGGRSSLLALLTCSLTSVLCAMHYLSTHVSTTRMDGSLPRCD